ncbi:MAG TPA: winged helix DNA-binding domain-containing protein [Blastocatellia bacterium]|nr:winged helix DNA-binding domain-containing protein [Blastocatellia bacterium]
MKNSDIVRLRLANQHLTGTKFDTPTEAVRFMGAVQAQDYAGGLWAVGLRTANATEQMIERALAERAIVRTWPMRRTLHFVAAEDVHWMLELLTPRVIAASVARQHYFGLDESVFVRCRKALTRALAGGKRLRRAGVYERLEAAGISTADGRGLHIVARLALEGLICFGAREGKQPTFALLDEWVPAARRLTRDEALAELARRYFTSHGPATVQDYVWWSGLTTKDARAGIEMAKSHLAQEKSDGQTYWLSPAMTISKAPQPATHLLPPYDEYTVAYKDRSAVLDPSYAKRVNTGNGVFSPAVVVEGQLVGLWTRTLKKDTVVIMPTPFEEFSAAARRAIARAANRYGEFLGVSAVLA